jgi:small-conductance mechanosensitive channel
MFAAAWHTGGVQATLVTAADDAADFPVDVGTLSAPLVVFAIALGAWILTKITGFLIRRVVRRIADRSLVSPTNLWRTRSRRVDEEPAEVSEQRRRQRVDAASRMINHLVSLVIWLVATIAVFQVLDINAAFFLSSAGFIGAAVAIGGQHKVNDYLTGLLVHFEDRYGVGDEIVAEVNWSEPVHAVVDHIGLFTTRVRDETSTMHFPNTALSQVRNLSQESATTTIRLKTGGRDPEEVAETLRHLAGTSDLTGLVFIGDIESRQPSTGEVEVDVHTLRPLGARATDTLVERAEHLLGVERATDEQQRG